MDRSPIRIAPLLSVNCAALIVLLVSLFAPWVGGLVALNSENKDRPIKPNIVFIMADDLGFNDVGYHNNDTDIYTPTIDRLARQGVRLENYYVQPICTPTRSQFMSGRAQIHTGLQHQVIYLNQRNALPLDSPTLADKLKEAGYATDMVGKWHLGYYRNRYLPTRRGFDTFYGAYLGQGDHFTHRSCYNGVACRLDLHNETSSTGPQPDFNQQGRYSTNLFTDEAVRIIGRRAKENTPFFLFLSYQAVHSPIQVPRRYITDVVDWFGWQAHSSKRRRFAAMTLAMDDGIERVVAALKDEGVWDNTVLVFSTDNGGRAKFGSSNYPLRGGKWNYFEGGVRGVAFVNSPLLNHRGYVNHEMMHVSDWFPTFVSLANGTLDNTRDVNGFDQWATISQMQPSPRNEIFFNIDPKTRGRRRFVRHNFDTRVQAALRVGDFKIITGIKKRPGLALFNVRNDPNENHNLAKRPAYRNKLMELLDRLYEHQQTAVPVRFPVKETVTDFLGDVWQPWDLTG